MSVAVLSSPERVRCMCVNVRVRDCAVDVRVSVLGAHVSVHDLICETGFDYKRRRALSLVLGIWLDVSDGEKRRRHRRQHDIDNNEECHLLIAVSNMSRV